MRSDIEHVGRFLDAHDWPDEWIPRPKVYEIYQAWAAARPGLVLTRHSFYRALREGSGTNKWMVTATRRSSNNGLTVTRWPDWQGNGGSAS